VRAIENYALKLLKLSTLYQDLQIRIQLYAELVRLEKSFLLVWGFVFIRHRGGRVMIVLVVRTTGSLEILAAPQRYDGVSRWNSPPSASNRPTYHMHPQRVGSKGQGSC
jgi:hypothetical protein